jgi:hypothetical protein
VRSQRGFALVGKRHRDYARPRRADRCGVGLGEEVSRDRLVVRLERARGRRSPTRSASCIARTCTERRPRCASETTSSPMSASSTRRSRPDDCSTTARARFAAMPHRPRGDARRMLRGDSARSVR